jgi:hypothetical protein
MKLTVSMLAIVAVLLAAVNVMFIVSPSPVSVSTTASVAAIVADVAVIVSAADVKSAPEIVSVEVVSANDTGVTVVVVVSSVVAVVVVLDDPPQAANDRAISETPPARVAFAFFFYQTSANFSAFVDCLMEASISFRNAPVEIMFIFFAPYKFKA